MRLRLDYGTVGLEVDVPDGRTVVVQPEPRPALADPLAALTAACDRPVGSRPLRELATRGTRCAISVCDITRPQPRQAMLEALLTVMRELQPEDVTILIATGTHRANTPAELRAMLGEEIVDRYRVVNHDARDPTVLVELGRTAKSVPIHLNRAWVDADLRITTGFVEPHFFAGFSGGPKMVAPGLAGLETVMRLHDAERIGHPMATWGVTDGNPIHDDVREIAERTGVHFAVDVILNRAQQITAAFAGDLLAEHAAACAQARRDAMRPVTAPFEVVVTSNAGYPLDQNLYQAVKGMSAAAQVVREGGVIICAAECRDGLPDHGSYGSILRSESSPERLLDLIHQPGYAEPDQWQVQIQAQIQMRARVLVKTDYLTPDQLAAAHFEHTTDVTDSVRKALAEAGPRARLCVLPEGPQTIPYLAAGE